MNNERVTFVGATGSRLSALLSTPAKSRVDAYALFAHCFTCSKDLKAVVNISRALTQRGFGVLRFDFTGLGESEGDFSDTDFSSNVGDLVAAAAYMADALEPVAIVVGHSLGGAAVLAAAGRMRSARAICTIGAPFEPGHVTHLFEDSLEEIEARGLAQVVLAGRRFTVTRDFVEDLAEQRMERAIRGLNLPLLVFHSPVDAIVGIENAARIYQAARHPKSFVSLDDADHLLLSERDSTYVGDVLAVWASRTGAYDAVANWWRAAPDHEGPWTWGEVSGVAVDNPNRIIVAVWGDRDARGQERPESTNYLVVVDRDGYLIENWSQWDSIFNRPHQVYISPYDPERHVWVVERGGRGVNMQILKFTNDGSELVMRLVDPEHPTSRAEARANPNPGPYAYGDPAVLAFLPDGAFLLGDGYWHSRIVKYDADGEYLMEWGELGTGPGQFDLVHGLAVDRDRRVYVGDRGNNRIQIFTEDGEYLDEWPDISDPVDVFIDERDAVWVISGRLNRILKYDTAGQLQYHWGAYGGTMGGFSGGLSRPHQLDVDQEGNVYVASWDGGWLDKFVPKPGADPRRLIGRPLVLAN